MPANKLSDLLPIPEGTHDPHPYQVFGLEDGEQDADKIARAVQATVAKLKAAKSGTEEKLWGSAARLVQDARLTLTDPDKKAQLDARFGIISMSLLVADPPPSPGLPLPERPGNEARVDPLAALLPQADPLAAVLPPGNPLAPLPAGAGLPQQPPAATVPPSPAVAAVVVQQPARRRRRTSLVGMLMFLTLALGMLGLIGLLGRFLLFGPGQVAITNVDGQITISTRPAATGSPTEVSSPHPVNSRPRVADHVMGNLGQESLAPSRLRPASGFDPAQPLGATQPAGQSGEVNPLGRGVSDPMTAQQASPPPPDTEPPSEAAAPPSEAAAPPSEAAAPLSEAAAPVTPEMPTEPPAAPLSDEMIAAADQTLARVSDLIRRAQWNEMKPAAEAAREMPMNDAQRSRAEALYELAELATYYRGGIERAIDDLTVGSDFEVTDDFRVIIVEKGDDRLVVRYNARNRAFTFDELPFSLAHRLATFSMPASPATEAGKAAYQAIAPKATDEHRAEAVAWLRAIESEIDGTDPRRVADTIEGLFAGSD
jgi:hypothetical protein